MPSHRYMDEIGQATILAAKKLAAVTPEVYLRKCLTGMHPPNANKASHSSFETLRRHHQKYKTGVSATQTGLLIVKKF